MKFGPVSTNEAEGAILAHSARVTGRVYKKGRVLSAQDVAEMAAAGVSEVVVARLESGDVGEDEAAARLAAVLGGADISVTAPFTGRVNLFSANIGVLQFDPKAIDCVNRIHEGITVATLAPFAVVEPRQMVATVKIIPLAVSKQLHAAACEVAVAAQLRVAPFRTRSVALVQTRVRGTSEKVLDKTTRVTTDRLKGVGAHLSAEHRCDHEPQALATELGEVLRGPAELILVVGASAIVDRRDVIPDAIERIGGTVAHFGMPVDPGNLLLLGALGPVPVLGLPGCARSPKYNGFDDVLHRLCAGLEVSRDSVMALGVGGLLKDIPDRPAPRLRARPAAGGKHTASKVAGASRPKIGAVVLAAGQSRRMGSLNKLTASVGQRPMLTRILDQVLEAELEPVVVVTGHQPEAVRALLAERAVVAVHNEDFAEGLSTSLRAGLTALPDDVDGAMVVLGDMPQVSVVHLRRLMAAFDPEENRTICVPVFRGKRGNPVLWERRFFHEMTQVHGDVGARHLIGENAELVCEVAMEDNGVLVDVDSPDALDAVRAEFARG